MYVRVVCCVFSLPCEGGFKETKLVDRNIHFTYVSSAVFHRSNAHAASLFLLCCNLGSSPSRSMVADRTPVESAELYRAFWLSVGTTLRSIKSRVLCNEREGANIYRRPSCRFHHILHGQMSVAIRTTSCNQKAILRSILCRKSVDEKLPTP